MNYFERPQRYCIGTTNNLNKCPYYNYWTPKWTPKVSNIPA